jgi:hypothetical protein
MFIPDFLEKVEFTLVEFILEFQDDFEVTEGVLLQLRRELRLAARLYEGGRMKGPWGDERHALLFDPPLPIDPFALRRYQRPGPPFAILPPPNIPLVCEAGDLIRLSVVFWGKGLQSLGDFAGILGGLGKMGLHQGCGFFDLAAIEANDLSGGRQTVWQPGEDFLRLAPPIHSAHWWLDAAPVVHDSITLEILTPARLISEGKPLFRPTFGSVFPFILRRVTSMNYAFCGVEMTEEPAALVHSARNAVELENTLVWQDWRKIGTAEAHQDLGGIIGSIRLASIPDEIRWVLHLGSLLNTGKGAAFCAGHYRLLNASFQF